MGRGTSGVGGGSGSGSSGSGSNGSSNPTYKGITAQTYNYQHGVYRLGEGATESQALDIANNAPFTEASYGSSEVKALGVSVRSNYSVENTDGSVEKVSRDQTYSVSYSQNSDGTWSTSGTGTSADSKRFKNEATAERNARKGLATKVSEEMAWGRTLSMKTGNWKRKRS